jgi:uncharacterized protein (DUF1778 family)
MPRKVIERPNVKDEGEGEKKPSTVGFRPTDTVYKILREAEKLTGVDRSQFISDCIEEAAARVTERKLQEQYEKAKAAIDALKLRKGR